MKKDTNIYSKVKFQQLNVIKILNVSQPDLVSIVSQFRKNEKNS